MGYGVTSVHGTWSTAYGIRCAHCGLVHTPRTRSAARGDVEYGRSGIQRSWDPDEWDHDPGDIQMDEIPGDEILR